MNEFGIFCCKIITHESDIHYGDDDYEGRLITRHHGGKENQDLPKIHRKT